MAGRDKENLFIVTQVKDNYVYIVDGNIHKVENPKYKKIKHIQLVGECSNDFKTRLMNNYKISNQEVKKEISKLQAN